jgi:hypothetical protein
MALPQRVRVKLSSEAAGAISITPVVVQELPLRELVEHMLGAAGKDEARIAEMLRRGTLVVGASRFRWEGWEAEPEGLRELLGTFPDADPARAFAAAGCLRAVLCGGRQRLELPREALARKPLWRRTSYWDLLMEVVSARPPAYGGYSYRDRADRYARPLEAAEIAKLRAAAGAVRFNTLRDQIRVVAFSQAELYVAR